MCTSARSEWTSASVSSKDWAWTSTTSLTPTSQLESCSRILRVFRKRVQCQNGSTKRIPKRVRVNLSRTSRTDEAAEPPRKPLPPSRSVEKARKDAQSQVLSTSFLLAKTRGCHEIMPNTTRLATLPCATRGKTRVSEVGVSTSVSGLRRARTQLTGSFRTGRGTNFTTSTLHS